MVVTCKESNGLEKHIGLPLMASSSSSLTLKRAFSQAILSDSHLLGAFVAIITIKEKSLKLYMAKKSRHPIKFS